MTIATMPDLSEYLTTEQVADRLGYHRESVRRLIREEKLDAEKVAGVYLIHRDALKRYQIKVEGYSKFDPRR